MGHSIIDDARNATGVAPKVYFYSGDKPLAKLPVINAKPIALTTTVLWDEDGGKQKNPFKSKKSFSVEVELLNSPLFEGYISQDVADLCTKVLPFNAKRHCESFTLSDRMYNERLWMSRYLAYLRYNKRRYEEDIRSIARVNILLFEEIVAGVISFEDIIEYHAVLEEALL